MAVAALVSLLLFAAPAEGAGAGVGPPPVAAPTQSDATPGSGAEVASPDVGAPAEPVLPADAGIRSPVDAPASPEVVAGEAGLGEAAPTGALDAPLADAGTADALTPVADATPDAGTPPPRETTVIGQRLVDVRRVAGSAQVIGREELERREANDIHRVLQSVPGVYVREEDGFGLRPNIGLRGVNADRSSKVTLMEDGVLLGPAPYSAPAAYYSPLVTRMVAVEVFKGPASIRYGPQTIGGAINYRTRPVPQQFEGDLDLSLGNYGTGKAHGVVGYGTGRWGVLLEGVHLQTSGFKQLDGGGDTGFGKNEAMLKAAYATDPSAHVRNAFELKLGFSDERSNETYLGLATDDFEKSPLRRYAASQRDQMSWWRTQGVLTHRLSVGDWLEVTTAVYRHDFDRTWLRFDHFANGPDVYSVLAYPTGTNAVYRAILAGAEDSVGAEQRLVLVSNKRTFVSQGVQVNATAKLSTGPVAHELKGGVRLHHDEIRRLHTGHSFDMRNATLVPSGVPDEVLNSNVAYTRSFSGFLADHLSWGRLLVSPGVRVEVPWTGFGDELARTGTSAQFVVPLLGLGAVYGFDFGLSVLAGLHQGFSPVAPGQDAGVQPERAVNSEAGVRFAKNGLRAELIGFWSEYQNITGECTGSTGCTNDATNRQYNGGRARVLGLEALGSVRKRLPLGIELNADLAYTFTSARFLSAFTSENPIWGAVNEGDELPYIPVHQGQLRVRASRGPFELGLGGMYYGEVREVAGQGDPSDVQRVPGRVLLDVTASCEIGSGRVYLTATNLLNQAALVSRRPFGARPQAPLLLQVGFKYAFR
ncbi:MAG: TonB-dependent receptor [Myxococcota bacterium]